MKRALTLVIVIFAALIAAAVLTDGMQQRAGERAAEKSERLRRAVWAEDYAEGRKVLDALLQQWEAGESWLNCLISHHHTRAVSAALRRLDSSLRLQEQADVMEALDELDTALDEVRTADAPLLANIL